ncbi:MAG: NAD-dependent DNA ligase LigA [Lachnospiraceae bacterium]|nr:NAD-dependent DNA ligase LigA [Lachnospiraceae bacterium]
MADNSLKIERMKELIPILDKAAAAYYQGDGEIMSNFEYDALYDELDALEKETGVVLSGSPTVKVGYEVASSLPKKDHPSPMLSLAKTKDRGELRSWLGSQRGLLSWKLDGLTVVLTYEGGELKEALTRGDGTTGEVITQNALAFVNVPHRIAYKGELVLRGEAIISYADFESINSLIEDDTQKYKNPRNLCSGSVRQLDPSVTKSRKVRFIAFALVSAKDGSGEFDFKNSNENKYIFLKDQGFDVVEYKVTDESHIEDDIAEFSRRIEENPYPSDGLVLLYDDIAYGVSLGRTAKAPKNAMAFKWQDETAITHLKYVEWSPSRTGLINPVAVFDPVELEGTTVTRASVHNISIVEELKLGIGDEISVYKANMIIPQIAANLTGSGNLPIPDKCPACGADTKIVSENDTKTLVCTNPACPAKQIKSFELYCSKEAMNIEGLSEQTLEKFIARGFIREFDDLYHLERHADEIKQMEGFGEKSMKKLLDAVEKSRDTQLSRFLCAIGIPGIGVTNAKNISRHFDGDFEALVAADEDELKAIDKVGDVMAADIVSFFSQVERLDMIRRVLNELRLASEAAIATDTAISGLTFVVTGSLNTYANRNELKAYIESMGGKVTGSVTAKTDFLINNDTTSNSSKNKTAKQLNIPIISEEEFRERFT